METVSVVVADAQRLFAEALAGAMALHGEVEVLDHHSSTGLQAVEAFARHSPDVLVIDFWLPEMNGAAATRLVLERSPTARVLVLAWLYGPLQVREAHAAGAAGFLPKSVGFDEMIGAVGAVHRGEPVFPGLAPRPPLEQVSTVRRERDAARLELTPREVEVLQLACEGNRRDKVAAELGIREGTVKNHIHNILTKTGARTLLEAVTLARDSGLVRETGWRRDRK